jgi:predicted DNA-binding protein
MEDSTVPPRRAARRGSSKEAPKSHTKAVAIADETYTRLESATSKSGITKSKFASAAIAYFIDNGLDPLKAGVSELAQLRTLVGETTYEIRKQNVDIGNRLVAIMRTWEANQYKFMQTQQGGIVGYLESL